MSGKNVLRLMFGRARKTKNGKALYKIYIL